MNRNIFSSLSYTERCVPIIQTSVLIASSLPPLVSFTSVIDTLAKSGLRSAGQRGLQLLEEMEKMATCEDGEEDSRLRPNVFTYSACINAFAKSPDEDAPQR